MLVLTRPKVHMHLDGNALACHSTSSIHSTSDGCVMQHQRNESLPFVDSAL